MNSQRQSDKKNKAASAVFTKETFGVVTVLFATLCIICLITGDAVFFAPGKYIRDFIMGVFGYFAYPVGIYAGYKGVMLIVGKKSRTPLKRKALIALALVFAALFAHILSMGGAFTSYGEYISASYSRGENAFSAGGVVAALLAYFLQSLLTVVGSAVITGGLFSLCVYFYVADIVKGGTGAHKERGFRSSFVKNEDSVVTPAPTPEQPQVVVQNAENVSPVPKKPAQKLFINNGGDFGFKSRREIQKESGSAFKVDSSVNSLNVSKFSGSYSEGYTEDLQKKIEYVKTPAAIKIQKEFSNSDTTAPSVSDYISTRKDEAENKADSVDSDIPMIEHESIKRNDAKSRAAAFGERYASNNYRTVAPSETVKNDNITENANNVLESAKEMPKEPEKPVSEEPLSSRVREDRARSILFDDKPLDATESPKDDKPAFTSRALADDNVRRPAFGFDRNIEKSQEVAEEKPEKPPVPINRTYYKPPLDLLETYTPPLDAPKENHEERIEIIKRVLEEFRITVEPQGYVQGPTITRYEVKMPAGVPVKKVLSYDDDLKMRLQSKAGVRIEAPIPGKDGVGIEVANKVKITVGLKEVIQGAAANKVKPGSLIFALGKDIVGNSITDNLAKGPHYLVAGATGSGKSVCLNVMIVSMLMRYSPEELRLILIDPKRVGFRKYEHLPHLMIDEIITEPQKAVAVLSWAYKEMERRYDEFARIEGGLVSDIESYNELVANDTVPKMPRIVIVVDELADLMETCKKDMETNIRMLAQKARAAGIHLVLATQRPSVDVVTGTIKANLPSRIALKVMNAPDSITILSEGGAEKLLGNGDMLYKNSSMSEPERYQGAWISDREISNIVSYIKEKNAAYYDDELKDYLDKAMRPKQEETAATGIGDDDDGDGIDDFFLKALWLAITSNSVSISQLQRRFQIGYARAGGLVDKMERLGFVSGNEGSKARRVLITREEFEQKFGQAPDNY